MDTSLLPNELMQRILFYTDGIAARTCLLWYVLSPDKRVHMSSVNTAELLKWALQQGCQSWKYNHISTRHEIDIDSILMEVYHLLKFDQNTEEYLKTKCVRSPRWVYMSSSAEKRDLCTSAIKKIASRSLIGRSFCRILAPSTVTALFFLKMICILLHVAKVKRSSDTNYSLLPSGTSKKVL